MIEEIINMFYTQAKEHLGINGFQYGKLYETGSGLNKYPLFWLEDPISGTWDNNIFQNSLNFSILFIPKDEPIEYFQNAAFSFGLNILERIKKERTIVSWNYTTLRAYYDDNACGCRFSVVINARNMQNLCLLDEQFSKDKEFEKTDNMPAVNVSPGNTCTTFTNKLPVFDIKITK